MKTELKKLWVVFENLSTGIQEIRQFDNPESLQKVINEIVNTTGYHIKAKSHDDISLRAIVQWSKT